MTREELETLINRMKAEQRELRASINEVCWHMRGSFSREEAWTLCHDERVELMKYIEQRIKLVEKSGLPLI